MSGARVGGPAHRAGATAGSARSLLVPGAIAFVLIATVYLPTHASASGAQALLGAVAGVYVVGMTVILPRVVRVLILGGRRAAADAPFVRPGALAVGASPARRLAAVVAGAVVSGGLALVAVGATSGTTPGSYQHAIGTLAVIANLGLLLATLVPLPGLAGWEAVESFAAFRCPEASHHAAHTAHAAKAAAVALTILLGLAAIRIGDPMLFPLGLLAAATVWAQAEAVRRVDIVERFFASHTASQLSHPVHAVRRADEQIAELTAEAQASPSLVIDGAGLFVGAIGPRQMRAAATRPAARFGDAMVPARTLRIAQADDAAADIAADLEAVGIVLVRGERRYGAVDADDVVVQLNAWAHADALAARHAHRAA